MEKHMKPKELNEELLDLAKKAGIVIRKENGRFKSGYCVVNENKLIIINKTTPIERISGIVARTLALHNLDDIFVKPAVREFIESEAASAQKEKDFNLVINY